MSYDALITSAASLIQDKGVACTWRVADPTRDTDKPWDEDSTAYTDYSTYIVLLPFDSAARRMFGYAEGRTIPGGTVLGYVPGSTSFTPALRDLVVVGSTTYSVAAFDAVNPNADKDIVYVVELHR
jgi:hypothetical protein